MTKKRSSVTSPEQKKQLVEKLDEEIGQIKDGLPKVLEYWAMVKKELEQLKVT